MDTQKVDLFIMTNKKYFPEDKIIFMREKLLSMDDSMFSALSCVQYKDPTTILIVSIFAGCFGIDRFMLGDVGLGVLKLLTVGVCGIFALIDFFLCPARAREINFNNFMIYSK